jgi:4-amino-4-deoxy-L-arabinose transferase-like glycosyltransferase
MTPETRRRFLWVLGSIAIFRLIVMATMPLADNTESRYGEMAAMMVHTNDWITPYFDTNVPFWGKPPLSFWLSAACVKLFGLSEWSVRLPSWLATVAMGTLVYQGAKQVYTRNAALLATLCFASSVLVFIASGAMMTDAIFALGTTLSTIGIALNIPERRPVWGILAFVGLAIGLLSKGPLIFLLVGVALVGWLLLSRDIAALKRLPWVSGTLLMLLISVPWYILAEMKTPGFLNYFIVGEHFQRFIQPGWQGDLYGSGHKQPYGSIWVHMLWTAFPMTLIPLAFIYRALTTKRFVILRPAYSSKRLFLLCSALAPAIAFTLSGNILWTYVLPAMAPLSILLAPSLAKRFKEKHTLRWCAFFLMVPVACTITMSVLSIDFKQLRTEKYVIQALNRDSREANPSITYLELLPYSAKFYSQQHASMMPLETFKTLPAGTLPYVAIQNKTLAVDPSLAKDGRILYTGRHFTLLGFS